MTSNDKRGGATRTAKPVLELAGEQGLPVSDTMQRSRPDGQFLTRVRRRVRGFNPVAGGPAAGAPVRGPLRLAAAAGPGDHLAVDAAGRHAELYELDARANQLARFLIRRGVRPGDRIGLLFDEAVDGYAGMLAVLKAHAAYVPLDAGFPRGPAGLHRL